MSPQAKWWETWCGRTVPDDRIEEWTRPSPGWGNPVPEEVTCKTCLRSLESVRAWKRKQQRRRTVIMPPPGRPHTRTPHEAGTTWVAWELAKDGRSFGERVATIYRNEDGGHGADMSIHAGPHAGLVVGGGLPRLPLTRPADMNTGPLTWEAVAAEVEALMEAEGWVVLWADAMGSRWQQKRGGPAVGGQQ